MLRSEFKGMPGSRIPQSIRQHERLRHFIKNEERARLAAGSSLIKGHRFADELWTLKTIFHLLLTILIFAIALWNAAAQPANDNFENRITLEGNSLSFTGTLAGATTEESFEVRPDYISGFVPESVWWSWTANESLPVTLMVERINLSPDLTTPDEQASDYLAVWLPPDLSSGFPTNVPCSGCLVASMPLRLADSLATMTFTAAAGTTYQLQLRGVSTNDFAIRLIATNTPFIVEQPKSLTISPGASALFTIIAAGVRPFAYQWRFNGNELPGETAPMLALTNVSEAGAGLYSVLVSNVTGTSLSKAVTLTVNGEDVVPELTAMLTVATNRFGFRLLGEPGRFYRIESSTNLPYWQPENSFNDPRPRYSRYFVTSVTFQSNSYSSLMIPITSPHKFVRAVRYLPADELCHLHLKQIRFAKELWVRDNHMWGTATPNFSNLTPYFKNPLTSLCPSGGGYHVFHTVLTVPQCTVPHSVLEEPQ